MEVTRTEWSADKLDCLRIKYLKSYWIDRDTSTEHRSKRRRVVSAGQKVKCAPKISHYPKLQSIVQDLQDQGDQRRIACLLNELDLCLTTPGTMVRPESLRKCDDDVWIEEAGQSSDMIENRALENYVAQICR